MMQITDLKETVCRPCPHDRRVLVRTEFWANFGSRQFVLRCELCGFEEDAWVCHLGDLDHLPTVVADLIRVSGFDFPTKEEWAGTTRPGITYQPVA